jgi:hypothetical protein
MAAKCVDADGDGYGIGADLSKCTGSTTQADCNDTDPDVHPGAMEICDGKDTDCDGWKAPSDVDGDGDGFPICPLPGYLYGDCDDNNTAVNPDAPEICDGMDNDCNYVLLNTEWDSDGDGVRLCDSTPDCDDFDSTSYPGADEICDDSNDNNCDGSIDEVGCICPDADGDGYLLKICGGTDCNDSDPAVTPETITDNDGDGFDVAGLCAGDADCDDTDPDVHPGAIEICDGKDTDCDGWKAPSDVDGDGDGFPICALPGYLYGDCDDNNPAANLDAMEGPIGDPSCSDGFDNDCDYGFDSSDAGCFPPLCYTRTSPKNGPHFFTLLNPDDTIHADNNQLLCGKCHGAGTGDYIRYACQRCHADSSDPSDPLNGTIKDQYPLDPPYGYGTAPVVNMHSSSVVGTKYGNWTMGTQGCVVCHNPHSQEQDSNYGTSYGQYIKNYICFDNPVSGLDIGELVEFTIDSGPGSFADGPPNQLPNPPEPGLNYPGYPLEIKNVCEICHSLTNHHRNDGQAPGDLDGNSNYVGHYDGARCVDCHPHIDGFAPTGGTAQNPHNTDFFNSNCQLCHIEIGGVLDFSAEIPDLNCQRCHGERDAHTSDPGRNEFASGNHTYDIMCVDCHDPMVSVGNNRKLLRQQMELSVIQGSVISNTTIRGAGSLADGPPRNENVCETCHSLTSHNKGDGTGDGVHLDGINYDGTNCMLCHDHNRSFMIPGPSAED